MTDEVKKEDDGARGTNFPGTINFDGKPGCRAVAFVDADAMNEFFAKNNGCLVVQMFPDILHGGIVVLYTIVLSDEELELMNDRQQALDELTAEKTRERLASAQASRDAENAVKAEVNRLAALGKKCEHDHNGLVEENRKLKKAKK